MKTYIVYNMYFTPIGKVEANSAEEAFSAAKKKWPFVWGLMVEEEKSS